jgi:hypothetical protein
MRVHMSENGLCWDALCGKRLYRKGLMWGRAPSLVRGPQGTALGSLRFDSIPSKC